MKRITVLLLFLIFCLSVGCGSKKDEIVARVGNMKITLPQVHDYDILFPGIFESAQDEFEAKKRYVDSLIGVRLLVIGAYQNDLDIDDEVLKIMKIQKPKFLLDELFKNEVISKTSVTDAEIRDYYERIKEEVHIKYIQIDSEKLADSLYGAITEGADFDQLARDFSLDQNTAMNGGDLGYVRWGQFVESFQNEAFKLAPGQVSRPFETEYGWHIVKMVDRRESDPGSFEDLKEILRGQIQDRKRQRITAEYLKSLREKADIKLNEEIVQTIQELMDKVYPDTIGGQYFKKSAIDLDILEEYQKSQILAYFKGGEITVEEYMTALGRLPVNDRPDFKDTEAVKTAIFRLNLESFLNAEAEERKLADTESFKKMITAFKEEVMADKMRGLIIQSIPELTDDDIYDYYNHHIDEFTVTKQLRVREILVNNEDTAKSIRAAIDKGKDFGKLAEKYTVRPGMSSRKGDLGFFQPYKYPSVYEAAENMRIGEIKGPIKILGNNWSIIKVEDVKPPVTRKIEEVASDIRDELIKTQQKKVLDDWLAKRKAETKIEVDYDKIWKDVDMEKYKSE